MPRFNGYEKILEAEACKQYDFVHTIFYDEMVFFSLKKMPIFAKGIIYFVQCLISGNPHENKWFIKLRDFFLSLYAFPKFNKWISSKINPNLIYDSVVVIKGYGVSEKLIKSISTRHKSFYQWDNIVHFPSTLVFSRFFDAVYSFDKTDAEAMGWLFLPNFYLSHVHEFQSKSNDFFFVGVYSELRFEVLTDLVSWCSSNEYTYFIKLYAPCLQESDLITNEKVSKEKYNEMFKQSKYIVEITKNEQDGYSQRYLEALDNRSLFVVASAPNHVSDEGRLFSLLEFKLKERVEIDVLLESELSETEEKLLRICDVSNWLKILSGDKGAIYFQNYTK
tara:strand:- start:14595 stop:15599 length:1005 start_codon:yes stop_codon:yes gene_type:complete